MYTMGTMLKHGSDDQKRRYLPKIAAANSGCRPSASPSPTRLGDDEIETRAVRQGDKYIINGQKIFISRVKQSDLMLLLARTTPYNELKDKTRGLSVFLVDLRDIKGKLEIKPLDMMINHHTNILFFENVEVPVENLVGEEGQGFRHIIDGWNAERILIASEAIGDGRWFVERASKYASERVVFGRPIGANQACSFRSPSRSPMSKRRPHALPAAEKFDRGEKCGMEANSRSCLPPKPRGKPRTPVSTRMAATALRASTTSSASSARRGST
jgi:acyl-CoA dehydrogenase